MINLNLEFSGNVLRLLQLNQSKEIILKKEVNLSFNINEDQNSKKNYSDLIDEFEECLSEINTDDTAEIKTAGILISTEQTFLNVTPIDFNEDNNSISSHILWELSNYFPDNYKDFNIKYYRLNNNYLNENIDDALLIAINKNKLEFIKNLCDGADIRIKNIEIDHFAVEKCMKEKYGSDLRNKNVLLIGCKNNRLDFSLIVNELLKYYDYNETEGSSFKNLLARQVSRFSTSFYNLSRVFLYGEENILNVKEFLEEQYIHIPVTFVNFSDNIEEVKFAPLYGLALKNMV